MLFWKGKERQSSKLLAAQSRGTVALGQTWLTQRRDLHPLSSLAQKEVNL